MSYRVVIQRLAVQDLDTAYQQAAKHAPQTAGRWLTRFEQAIATLSDYPERCPLARENTKTDLELREFLFGRRPNVFRVIYTINHDIVRILRIPRAQRRFLSKKQIRDAADAGE